MPVTPFTDRTILSMRCFKSDDFTEPTIVTRPPSVSVLTSAPAAAESAANARSIFDWIVASSGTVGSVSPPETGGGEGEDDNGVGVTLTVGLTVGLKLGPAGTAC